MRRRSLKAPKNERSGCRRHLIQEMNEFEMIEKLVEKENVSFEEARDALKAVDGDLVDAIVYLERKAKEEATKTAEAEAQAIQAMADHTETDRSNDNIADNTVKMTVEEAGTASADEKKEKETMKEETRNTKNNTGSAIRNFFRKTKDILVGNALSVTCNGEEKVRIPAWLLAIILVCCFKFSAIVLIVSLFLGCRYSFIGKDDLSAANNVMNKAGDMADRVKAQFE